MGEYLKLRLLVAFSTLLMVFMPAVVGATAAPVIAQYPLPGNESAFDITVGPDGAIWSISSAVISRISTTGNVTYYPIPNPYGGAYGITTGIDGALWFTEANKDKIGRLSLDGTFTEYPVSTNSYPFDITTGPDGALWFTEVIGDRIGRITTSGVVTEYPILNQHASQYNESAPYYITTGPDGALWFTEVLANKIGRMTTSGVASEYVIPTTGSHPLGITAGPDGALWFTERDANNIGRLTPQGVFTEFPVSEEYNAKPWAITAGPDGALWFTEYTTFRVGRITLSGDITKYSNSYSDYALTAIISGPDSTLWYAQGGVVGRITMPTIPAPNSLTANSPAQNPLLAWGSVNEATSYNIYRDGVNIASTTDTSYADTTATEGTHNYYVTAVGADMESEPSSTVKVVVDRTAPVVNITSLVPGQKVTGVVTISASIIEANPSAYNLQILDHLGKVVESYVVQNPVGSTFVYEWDTTDVKNQTYSIVISATDALGNTSPASTQTIEVKVK